MELEETSVEMPVYSFGNLTARAGYPRGFEFQTHLQSSSYRSSVVERGGPGMAMG